MPEFKVLSIQKYHRGPRVFKVRPKKPQKALEQERAKANKLACLFVLCLSHQYTGDSWSLRCYPRVILFPFLCRCF